MKKLIQGIVDFGKKRSEEDRALFAKLALGQKPDALFIGCSDSRVAPNVFASTDPGDLFVLRNVGNLVPPASSQELDVPAALEFAIFTLNVSNIIVCGHSECGACQTLVQGIESAPSHLKRWLHYGEEATLKVKKGFTIDPTLAPHNQVSQVNVLQQMEHLATYPFIQERLKKTTLRLHGWWFDIGHADVYCYEEERRRFILIDEEEATLILKRLNS